MSQNYKAKRLKRYHSRWYGLQQSAPRESRPVDSNGYPLILGKRRNTHKPIPSGMNLDIRNYWLWEAGIKPVFPKYQISD